MSYSSLEHSVALLMDSGSRKSKAGTKPPNPGRLLSTGTAGTGTVVPRAQEIISSARYTVNRAVELTQGGQKRLLQLSRELPFVRRFSPDYIRGATEAIGVAVAFGTLAVLIRRGTCRYRVASDIPKHFFHPPRTLHGYILSVNDGDGVRFYHTPWLQRLIWPRMPRLRKLSNETISVRLAGVDAPEMSHYGVPGQKFGKIAKEWLAGKAHRRHASLEMLGQDQYNRVVGVVHVKHENPILRFLGLFRKNMSMELLKAGYAQVYRGPNAFYGGLRESLEKAERRAIQRKLGFWGDKRELTPEEFKKKTRQLFNNSQESDRMALLLPGSLLSKALMVLKGLGSATTSASGRTESQRARRKSKRRGRK